MTESAVLTNDLSNEALGNISNASSIKDYLVWPESPIRKGNRNSERMPFVLTSEQWKNLQAEKREKKNNTEKEKEERKRKRIQKKEENELEKLNKKKFKEQTKNNKNKSNRKSNSDLLVKKVGTSDKTEKVTNDKKDTEKQILDSKKCLQKINVISNIQINKAVDPDFNADANEDLDIISKIQLNEAIEAAKKTLFEENEKENDEGKQYEVRGNLIKRGICYICVRSINVSCHGFKCSICNRTYHESCIKNHRLFDISVDETFTCKTCKCKK